MSQRTTSGVFAKDIMTRDPVCVEPSMTIRQFAQLLEEEEISGAPVIDAQGRCIGVVSKTDLIRRCVEGTEEYEPGPLFEALLMGEDGSDTPSREPEIQVEDFMNTDPITVSAGASMIEIARTMSRAHVHRVVVVDAEMIPIGIVTTLDLLRAFSEQRA